MEILSVSIAEFAVAKSPVVLETQSLGSCIGIVLFDPATHVGGLAHVMLPDSKKVSISNKPGKYADTAIREMLDKMVAMGANKGTIIAKIVGGACMFSGTNISEFLNIGFRNVSSTKNILKEYRIPLIAEDCGGSYGRTVEFHTDTGKLIIKSATCETKEL
jgi:chemotaxis protein CheD